mgnify:CR=1 FL=1
MTKEKILVVDDEIAINKLVCSYLSKEQFQPFAVIITVRKLGFIKKRKPRFNNT